MTLNRNAPGSILSRVSIIGHPFHGLVQAGKLTLPNAQEIDYTQPAAGALPDLAGETHLLQRPGVPAVERSTEEAAEDTARGYQWRTVAMLSGANRQLYTKALNGWVYIDPAGDRWLVTTGTLEPSAWSTSSAVNIVVRLRRFGVFGGSLDFYDHAVSLSDMGQGGDTLTWLGDELTTVSMRVHAIQPDGSKAAVMVHRNVEQNQTPTPFIVDPTLRYACGWLELSIAGAGASATVALTVLKTRAETLNVQRTVFDPFNEYNWRAGWYWPLSDPEAIVAYSQETLPTPSGNNEFEFVDCHITTGDETESVAARHIVAMWPDGSGGWNEVVLQQATSITRNLPAPEIPSPVTNPFERTYTMSGSWSIGIEVGGVMQSELTASYTASAQQIVPFRNETTKPTIDVIYSGNTFGQAWSGTKHFEAEYAAGPSLYPMPYIGRLNLVYLPDYATISAANLSTRLFTAMRDEAVRTGYETQGEPTVLWNVHLVRYSNNVLGFRVTSTDEAGDYETFRYHPPVTPSGVQGTATDRPYDTNERMYASWCPHTDALAWLQSAAVCWV